MTIHWLAIWAPAPSIFRAVLKRWSSSKWVGFFFSRSFVALYERVSLIAAYSARTMGLESDGQGRAKRQKYLSSIISTSVNIMNVQINQRLLYQIGRRVFDIIWGLGYSYSEKLKEILKFFTFMNQFSKDLNRKVSFGLLLTGHPITQSIITWNKK